VKQGLTYAARVRRLFLILLVLVLPLRAVAGDFMALGMATMPAPAAAPSAAMPPDCLMHMAGAGKLGDSSSPQTGEAQCESCALCFPVAQFADFPFLNLPEYPEVRPPSGDADFLSAPRVRSFRPPSL
jgi:hypothetical protein